MTIDCITGHTAFVYDRGGVTRLGEGQLVDIAEVRWSRVRDDISEANVKIAAQRCFAQERLLERIEAGRHELVIYRGRERVWEGPITRVGMDAVELEIHAKDVMHYVSRTAMQAHHSNAHPNTDFALERIKHILTEEFTRKQNTELAAYPTLPTYNLLPHVVYHQTATDARTARVTKAMEKTVWEEIDDMAAKGGIDYTVIGRAIHFWDTSKPLGQTRTVTQADFNERIAATMYGMDLATRAIVTDGEGKYGTAGGVHPFYGLVENLETAYDETEGSDPPTAAEMASQAKRNLVGRVPSPIVLRVPDNSSINPTGVLSIKDLVPGVYMPLRAKILIRTFNQMQKLDKMSVIEDSSGEKIQVVMSPASDPDEVEE